MRRSGCGPSPPAATEGCGPSAAAASTQDGHHPIGVSSAQPPPSHRAATAHSTARTPLQSAPRPKGNGPKGPATVRPAAVWTTADESEFPGLSRWLNEAASQFGVSIRSADRSDGGGKTSVFACDGGLGLPGCSCACGLLWADCSGGRGENQRTGLGAAQMPGGGNGALFPVRAGISGPGVAGTARGAAEDAASRYTRRRPGRSRGVCSRAGATRAAHQPRDDLRVLLDPAGHPFCLFLH